MMSKNVTRFLLKILIRLRNGYPSIASQMWSSSVVLMIFNCRVRELSAIRVKVQSYKITEILVIPTRSFSCWILFCYGLYRSTVPHDDQVWLGEARYSIKTVFFWKRLTHNNCEIIELYNNFFLQKKCILYLLFSIKQTDVCFISDFVIFFSYIVSEV